MEFRKIQMFIEVVRQQGFSRAAEVVFSTQSNVSKAVRQLENELGVQLLDRGVRGIAPTAAGEVVFRRGLRLLAERDDMMEEIAAIQGLQKGTLLLGLPQIGASALFAPVFTLYHQRYPGIDIQLVEHGSDQLEEILRAGEVELAASLLPVPKDFEWQEIRREPLAALISPVYDHVIEHVAGRAATLANLQDVPFILFEDGFALNRIILAACRRHGFEPNIIAKSSQISFICELAAAGLGVAFLPRLIAEMRRGPGVRVVALDEPETDWHMAAIWRRGGYLSHAARVWLDILHDLYPGERSTSIASDTAP